MVKLNASKSKTEPLSYAECVRRIIRAAKAPMSIQEIIYAVARMRPLSSRHPDQTIRSALTQTDQIVHTGTGYWYLPDLLKDNVFRLPLTPEALRSGTLALTDETMCALWPSFHESASLRDDRPPRIQLERGIMFKELITHLEAYQWGWKKSRVLRDWLRQRRAKKDDALILTVRDGQARRYALCVEPRSQCDEAHIAERNRELIETTYRLWRAIPGDAGYLAPRLIARGFYHDPFPPDPLLPLMEQDSRFKIAKVDLDEKRTPAERREIAENWLDDGLEWLEQGNVREAEKSFWKSVDADETYADGYNHLGNLDFERGDWHRAEEFYRLALEEASKEFDPNNRRLGWWGRIETRPLMRALHGIGLCQWKARKFREAIATFEQMMAMNPNDNQGVRYLIGGLYHELGKREQAAHWYRKTADDPHVLFNWAVLCLETHQREDAITRILQGTTGNLYIAPRLLGKYAPRYTFWHSTNLEEPAYAADYYELYRHLWKRKGALKFLCAVWSHPSAQTYLGKFIELREQLTDEKDSERRRELIDAESLMRRTEVFRPIARLIARDLGSHGTRRVMRKQK